MLKGMQEKEENSKCQIRYFLPKLNPSGGEVDVQGPDIKDGKFHMPSIDISLPGGESRRRCRC